MSKTTQGNVINNTLNLVPRSPTAKGKGDLTFQCKTEWDLGTRLQLFWANATLKKEYMKLSGKVMLIIFTC